MSTPRPTFKEVATRPRWIGVLALCILVAGVFALLGATAIVFAASGLAARSSCFAYGIGTSAWCTRWGRRRR